MGYTRNCQKLQKSDCPFLFKTVSTYAAYCYVIIFVGSQLKKENLYDKIRLIFQQNFSDKNISWNSEQ